MSREKAFLCEDGTQRLGFLGLVDGSGATVYMVDVENNERFTYDGCAEALEAALDRVTELERLTAELEGQLADADAEIAELAKRSDSLGRLAWDAVHEGTFKPAGRKTVLKRRLSSALGGEAGV